MGASWSQGVAIRHILLFLVVQNMGGWCCFAIVPVMFATTNSPSGSTIGITVNKTPVGPVVVPVPYPSIGQLMMFDPSTLFPKVLIHGFMSAVLMSKTTMTTGDTAGVLGGVVSGTVMGPAQVTLGSPKVMMGGKPAATQLSMYITNGSPVGNAPANQVSPSCPNVIFAP